jgi:RHS repeat-associated protein
VCHDVVTRTVWDGDRILHEIRAPASRMEEDTAVAAEGGSGDPRTGQVTYVFGAGLDQPLALYREGYHPLFPERIHIVPHADWRGDYDMGTYDGLLTPPCKALPPVNPGDHEQVGGGPDSQQDTVPRPPHYVCMVVEWPAAYLWMSHLSRENTPAGPRSWTGSLIQNKRDLTGLLYMRNRYYDPKTGRFTQEDPIGLAGGLNAYGFADGDPVSYSDPYGLMVERCPPHCPGRDLGIIAGGVIGAGAGVIATGACAVATEGACLAASGYIVAFGATAGAAAGGILGYGYDLLRNDDADPVGTSGGARAGRPFTPTGKRQVEADNTAPDGSIPCAYCAQPTTSGQGSNTSREIDHVIPKAQQGNGDPSNGAPACRTCNRQKGNQTPRQWQDRWYRGQSPDRGQSPG